MAMGQHCRILQVVGFQNSGKTTLMEKLIRSCSERGWQTASIKHHGHATPQKREITLKDSERHHQAGAFMTTVEGGGSLQLHVENQTWSLPKLLELHKLFEPDVILVEGFKKESFTKVVLLRGEEDLELLQRVDHVLCAIAWEPLKVKSSAYPIYHIKDDSAYLDFILKEME